MRWNMEQRELNARRCAAPRMKVVIHDDLLATGGTAAAAAQLAVMKNASVSAFTFVVELDFWRAGKSWKNIRRIFISLVNY